MAELAKREQATQRYIAHILSLAFLAPDIMSRIVQGNIPHILTMTHLKKGFPMDWDEQRRLLSFN